MTYDIEDKFPKDGDWKYKSETIREVLQKDSGYVKDLIMKSDSFSLSDTCMQEAMQITKGHRDTWKRPENPRNIFENYKTYKAPYGFDFNDKTIQEKNKSN